MRCQFLIWRHWCCHRVPAPVRGFRSQWEASCIVLRHAPFLRKFADGKRREKRGMRRTGEPARLALFTLCSSPARERGIPRYRNSTGRVMDCVVRCSQRCKDAHDRVSLSYLSVLCCVGSPAPSARARPSAFGGDMARAGCCAHGCCDCESVHQHQGYLNSQCQPGGVASALLCTGKSREKGSALTIP